MCFAHMLQHTRPTLSSSGCRGGPDLGSVTLANTLHSTQQHCATRLAEAPLDGVGNRNVAHQHRQVVQAAAAIRLCRNLGS